MSLCHAVVVTAWFSPITLLVNGCQKVLLCKGSTMGCFNIHICICVLCVQVVSSTSQTQSIDQERDLNVIYCLHNIFTKSWLNLIRTQTKYMGKSNICSKMARPVRHCVETKALLIFQWFMRSPTVLSQYQTSLFFGFQLWESENFNIPF